MIENKKELLAIQKKILKSIKQEIKDINIDEPIALRKYFLDYKKASKRHFQKSNKQELLEAILSSGITILGDFHTFSQAQKSFLRILRNLNTEKIIIYLEMFMNKDSSFIEMYRQNSISKDDFLAHIKYSENWGFPFENYEPILNFAKEHGIKIVGLNTPNNRDVQAAKILINGFLDNPDYYHLALFGDLHLAPNHLPKAIKEVESKINLTCIHQNIENVYWKLAEKGIETTVDVVKFNKNEFCIMNSTPWIKLQSYLAWHEYRDNLFQADDEDAEPDYASQIKKVFFALADFFEIEVSEPDFSLSTTDDFKFIKDIKTSKHFTSDEKKFLEKNILINKNIFIPRINNIHVSSKGQNILSEYAANLLYRIASSDQRIYVDSKNEFYLKTLNQVRGFLGSKLINHRRKLSLPYDLIQFNLENKKSKNPKIQKQIYENKIIINFLQSNKYSLDQSIYKKINYNDFLDRKSKYIGMLIGNLLHELLLNEKISKSTIRDIFVNQYTEKEAMGIIVKFLQKIPKIWFYQKSKEDQL